MLVLLEANPRSGLEAPDNPHYMVICRVGPGPSRALQESTQGLDPLACRGGQVH
jgi:hypothetical protein